jgi:hypothetical protein
VRVGEYWIFFTCMRTTWRGCTYPRAPI